MVFFLVEKDHFICLGIPFIRFFSSVLSLLSPSEMGKILAIDYGTKRVGLACTDPMQLIASGLCTVETKTAIDFIVNYCKDELVEKLVIGEPKQMDNTPSESTNAIAKFTKILSSKLPDLPIVQIDERFTSKMAFQTMIDSGLGKKARKNKGLIDEISATIILQSYLEQQ
jgi:putative Holliday junction resolvase